MPGKPFKKKGWNVYEALRDKGMSKEKAAKITSAKSGTRLKKRKK
jgi:hypothetical protein